MLVLSRTIDDAICIDDHIEITVLAVQGNTVRLGFTAPSDVAIHRSEIHVGAIEDSEIIVR